MSVQLSLQPVRNEAVSWAVFPANFGAGSARGRRPGSVLVPHLTAGWGVGGPPPPLGVQTRFPAEGLAPLSLLAGRGERTVSPPSLSLPAPSKSASLPTSPVPQPSELWERAIKHTWFSDKLLLHFLRRVHGREALQVIIKTEVTTCSHRGLWLSGLPTPVLSLCTVLLTRSC